ncbi:PREDICTED: sec-independent protein translocase protein TATA, chloroplastic-like [Tarenaya hassleriana]|uniref:sec-independent protein translocase protein TATA, chloroplastic-like n=1 Tax=Tarenaya hassleriana TaxID=28532 RepID=UPI00053C9856|nr:PREDICTED: sec-independent protein translocase protein TATA, chloroplastic-like [Tarenaya hassleriana]
MEISSLSLSSVTRPAHSSSIPFSFSSSSSSFYGKTRIGSVSLVSARPGTRILTRNLRSKKGFTCYALFGLGVPELVVIAGVAALVFGPKKLPEVGRSIGKTVRSFQEAAKEFESELKKEPAEALADGEGDKPKAVSNDQRQEGAPSSKETE